MTAKIRKALARELLDLANSYEPKQRKFLRNIRYGSEYASWSGHAHDYTAHVSQLQQAV